MLSLNDREWKDFRLLDYFDFLKGNQNNMAELNHGKMPLVSARNVNNGYKDFVSENPRKTSFQGNCLTINNDGDGGAGISYYQPCDMLLDTHVTALYPKTDINRDAMLFISSCITVQREKFGHGYSLNNVRLSVFRVMLPVAEDGTPDYAFMEQYIREREQQIIQKYVAHIGNIAQIGGGITPLNQKEWKEFYLHDIFPNIRRGKRLKTADHISGSVPYVSSSAETNGVDGFIGNTGRIRKFSDCLTIANSGSVAEAFYHRYEFIASDHVTALSSPCLNEYSYLFVSVIVERLQEKYSFNREINDVRINKEKIILPVTDDGIPDYAYMEQYVKTQFDALKLHYLKWKRATVSG